MNLNIIQQPMQPMQPRGETHQPIGPSGPTNLTPEEQTEVQKLKTQDREVRAHEQAHLAAGGQYVTSGATYSYEQGPDGQRYATGGEVGIDTSAESGDPEATIRKMQIVKAAALAPASPSSQDHQVAAQADQKATQARAEMQAEKLEETKASDKEKTGKGRAVGSLIDIRA